MRRLGSLNLKLLSQSMLQDSSTTRQIMHPVEEDESTNVFLCFVFRPEVTLTIADELKRARAIAEIGPYYQLCLHLIT